ncbi:MAG: hypothetical protein KDK37_18685, partial [Leptospiraceae bacterium]|nr:hypothetical protein [Leptospiraceae bacterium]
MVLLTAAWLSSTIRAESPGSNRQNPADSPAPGKQKSGESASTSNDPAGDNSPPYRAPVETNPVTESKESTAVSATDKPSERPEVTRSEATTPREKAEQ